MTEVELVSRAKALLDRLAEAPRFSGSSEESRARALCRTELERCGFTCSERPFEFSEWPARWGPSIAAVIQVLTLLMIVRIAARGSYVPGLFIAVIAAAVLGVVGRQVRRTGVVSFSYARSRSVNLEATRGNPSVWLVAHLDSKSQTVPMLLRIASSVVLQFVSALIVAALVAATLGAGLSARVWLALEIAAVVAALPIMLCFVGNHSRGAVDNSTGVVTTLLAASQPSAPNDLGVLITSAEELGLAGARVWAASAPRRTLILNCDTVDDVGDWRCMYSGKKPPVMTSAAESVARGLGVSMRVGRLIPGILADNVAFADVRINAVTISRGNFSTLARIHTWRDNSIAQTGRGAAEASVLLSALAKELV